MTFNDRKKLIALIFVATLFLVAILLILTPKKELPKEEPQVVSQPVIVETTESEIEPEPVIEPESVKEEPIEDHTGQVIYLTFDDGPGPYTKELLDILDQYKVKATFFVTNQKPEYINLIKEIYNRGHKIGVHTYSHDYEYIYSDIENYITDYNKMNEIILEQTGDYSNFFRFPGGTSNTVSKKYKEGIMTELTSLFDSYGIRYYDWNIDATNQDILQSSKSRKSSVVLMHDSRPEDIIKVKELLPKAQKMNYTFKLIDESVYCQHSVNN